jgi:sugar O-acyltransferase (sialic acid O-acetyltransferase NeuD family)
MVRAGSVVNPGSDAAVIRLKADSLPPAKLSPSQVVPSPSALPLPSWEKFVAFTVDAEYRKGESFQDLPLVDAGSVATVYPPDQHVMFVAMSYAKMNRVRAAKYDQMKSAGYRLVSYVSSRCSYLSDNRPGENCFILEDNTIQPFTQIGNDVILWSGNHIGHHALIGENCFITSQVVISGAVKVGNNTFIGVNATIRDHVAIGAGCVIGAGSLVLKDIPDDTVCAAAATEPAAVPASRLRKI